jgi:hypothetical protein
MLKRWQRYFQILLKSPESELSADNSMYRMPSSGMWHRVLCDPTFRRNVSPPSSGQKNPALAGGCSLRLLAAGLPSLQTFPSPLYLFPMWPILPPSLFLYSCFSFDWQLSLQPPTHAASLHSDFSTLKMDAIRSSETSVHTRRTRRHIPEYDILHSHRRENLKSETVCRYAIWRRNNGATTNNGRG